MKEHHNLWRRIFSTLFLAFLLTQILPFGASAALEDRIRVGLYYGSNALATANLANETGSGFSFGFYDSQYQFIRLGETDREKITMCPDSNFYLSGGAFYSSNPGTGRLVGAYHLQPNRTFATYEDALSAAESYPYGFPAYVGGEYVVRFEFYSSAANAQTDAAMYGDVSVVGGSGTCYTVVDTQTGDILFEFDSSGASLAVMPRSDGPEPRTWFKGYLYYGGFQYLRQGSGLSVINVVDTDRYVAGVLPYEFVCSGGIESLKAGTVAIRTFARSTTKHRSQGFDVCNTTDCQVYRGVYMGGEAQAVEAAASATSGKCLYYDNALIQAVFYAANGGMTESAGNTWGYDYPYLVAQRDPYEDSISFASQAWSYHITPEQVQSLLRARGNSAGRIVSMEVTEWTEAGNVNRVVITDENGKQFYYAKDNVRILQNLSGVTYFSRRFSITPVYSGGTTEPVPFQIYDGTEVTDVDSFTAITASGTVTVDAPSSVLTAGGLTTRGGAQTSGGTLTGWTISGRGFGHNVGMSQWGAYAMAKQGFSYEEILSFYYPGTTLR